MSFAHYLDILIARRGKTMREIADDVGISRQHLSDLRSGRADNPKYDLIVRVSDYFEVHPGYFFSGLRGVNPDIIEAIKASPVESVST